MKALVLHGAGDIRYEKNWVEPEPKRGWAMIRVKYSGICGSDLQRIVHLQQLVETGVTPLFVITLPHRAVAISFACKP